MKHFHEKDSLADLMAKWHLFTLKSSSINKLGLNSETSENLLQILKNLKLGLYISQRPIIVILTISFIVINPISYVWVPLPCVTIIFVVYHCLYTKIVKTKQTQLANTLLTNIINKGELSGNI